MFLIFCVDFPLYTEAIKFFKHKEVMIRIAVRQLTLNVYRVGDDALRLEKTSKLAPKNIKIDTFLSENSFWIGQLCRIFQISCGLFAIRYEVFVFFIIFNGFILLFR